MKKHRGITVPFSDFLQNSQQYDQLEQLWKQWFAAIAEEYDMQLVPFYTTHAINGEKIRDANPIFSALAPKKNRLIRLLQTPTEEAQEIYIQGWMDVFGKEEGDAGIEELVIDLVFSDTAKALAKSWIIKWLVEDWSKAELEALMDEQSILCN